MKPLPIINTYSEIYLAPELEKDLKDRLSRIEGHVRGISKMLSEHKSCDDILIQVSAVRAALTSVSAKLLEGHIETCVSKCVETGEGKEALNSLKGAIAATLKQA